MKLILNIPAFEHGYDYLTLAKQLDLPTVNQRMLFLSLGMAYNQKLNNYDPCTIINPAQNSLNLRRPRYYVVPYRRITHSQKSISVIVPKFLNEHSLNMNSFSSRTRFLDAVCQKLAY